MDIREVDEHYASKYPARWILGRDLMIGDGINIGGSFVVDRVKELNCPVIVAETPNGEKTNIAHVPMLTAYPIYLPIESAVGLVERLKKEINNGLEILSEPILYDQNVLESLVAVHLTPGYDPTLELKQLLQEISAEYGAQILSLDISIDGKFQSIDFGKGLQYRSLNRSLVKE
ncbi:MAG: hypothetical protein J7K73_02960 [Nanoarchaeota archaeon]|nr:hypothetical protein [Nanoarchaeota archaeon]